MARPVLTPKEERTATTKMRVTLTPSKQGLLTLSRRHRSLLTEGDSNKVAMGMEMLTVKLPVRLQDMVCQTGLLLSNID